MKKNIIILFFLFVFLVILSEVLYTLFKNPSEAYQLFLAEIVSQAQNGDFDKSFRYLYFFGKLKNVDFSPTPSGNDFRNQYLSYLSKQDVKSIISARDNKISQIFYTLGIYAYENHEEYLVPKFFRFASLLETNLSFYRVELANYYFLSGNLDLALKEIKDCLTVRDARAFCEKYKEGYLDPRIVKNVGFMKESVDYFYSH
jgi:hypothetical protein